MRKKNEKQIKTLIEKMVDQSWKRHERILTVMSEIPECWPERAEAMRRIAADGGVSLDYSLASIQDLEDILLETRLLLAPDAAMSAFFAGCYFGETLIRTLGGKWLYRAEGLPYAQSANGIFSANVIGKCSQLLRTGERGCLVAMANAAQDFSRYSEEDTKAFMEKLHDGKAIHANGYTVKSGGNGHAG